jgi:hypothetical protein
VSSAGTHFLAWALALAAYGAGGGAAHAEANGIKFGESRLHPFFELESRYDSAALAVAYGNNNPDLPGDLLLHFKPGLKLDMPSSTLAVGLNGNLDYVLYTGLVKPGTRNASRMQGEADLQLGINRPGNISLDVGDHVTKSDRVTVPTIAVGALSLYNDARLVADVHPSGGAVQLTPSYHLITENFSPIISDGSFCDPASDPACPEDSLSSHNYLNHVFGLSGRWKFLPKTAMTIDSAFLMRRYQNSEGGTPVNTLRASAGLAGLVTKHISTIIKLGWGQDFTTSSFSSPVAQAELAYLLSQSGEIKAGYVRTFEPVSGGSFVTFGDDRAYLNTRLLLGYRVAVHGALTMDFISYRSATGEGTRSDNGVTADLGADWEFRPWAVVGGGYLYSRRSSDDQYAFVGKGSFSRNEVYFKCQVIY